MAGCPDKILELVARFEEQIESYKSGKYNETQVRRDFIDPMFKELGWDIDNEDGHAEAYRDVIHEDSVLVGGDRKAPDYGFTIGGRRKFFLEAKKPSIYIKEDIGPAFQIRRYAWSAKLPISILTDFEEFAVYDCRIKPVKSDKASVGRILYLNFREYKNKWDEISSVFSKDAVLKGSFDRHVESTKKKKGTAEVDTAFLSEIESWREKMAKNIALRNPKISQRDLNYAVQTTIDRIIFLRICEDRGIESYGRLMSDLNGVGIYKRLVELFYKADDKYNSGLFHFKHEKGRSSQPDELTTKLKIDDKLLKEMIKGLYYPDSPYEFSVLPADILGQVYEQFLGKVIRLTAGHQAKVEDKPEVKKAGGVYYTPTYIVDYIVKNTVGTLLEGNTPKKVEQLKIVDPACGSGSFLLGAYQYLLDWHREYYFAKGPGKHKKELYKGHTGDWRLTIQERKRILLNNIHGVDIDLQAVETTKLSLLLKVLENESAETLNKNLKLFKERALPDLSNNIKCGNSLIGTDYNKGTQIGLLGDEEVFRINAFDWEHEFAGTMKSGGFDAVIGNPPYVRQEALGEFKGYFERRYKTYNGVADLYVYFIEKGVSLLKEDGLFSYIVANKWMRANYGENLRRWMKERDIEEIVDFGDLPVFQKATTYPCILRIKNNLKGGAFKGSLVESLEFDSLENHIAKSRFSVDRKKLEDSGWSLVDKGTQALIDKLRKVGVPLGEYVEGKIFYGIKTALNEAFVIDSAMRKKLIKDDPKSKELIKPFLVGRDIKRYGLFNNDRFLILIPKGWTNNNLGKSRNAWEWFRKNYPAVAKHLEHYEAKAKKRQDKGDYWWELRACDYYAEFEKPKMISPAIIKKGSFAFDFKQNYSNDKTTVIGSSDNYLLGILNSSISNLVMRHISSTKQGGYFEYKPMYIEKIPIYAIKENEKEGKVKNKIASLVDKMLELNKKLGKVKTAHDKTLIQRQIDATDREIDQLVYKLYGLTEKEIKIVEEAT